MLDDLVACLAVYAAWIVLVMFIDMNWGPHG